jgi:hypothetical protein
MAWMPLSGLINILNCKEKLTHSIDRLQNDNALKSTDTLEQGRHFKRLLDSEDRNGITNGTAS